MRQSATVPLALICCLGVQNAKGDPPARRDGAQTASCVEIRDRGFYLNGEPWLPLGTMAGLPAWDDATHGVNFVTLRPFVGSEPGYLNRNAPATPQGRPWPSVEPEYVKEKALQLLDFAHQRNLGVNVYLWDRPIKDLGVLERVVEDLRGHPALRFWLLVDEPVVWKNLRRGLGFPVPQEELIPFVKERCDLVRRLDQITRC